MTDSSLLDIDELRMYFGEPFKINDKITIFQPTLGDVIEHGERKYYSMVHILTCIPADMMSQLADMNVDYMEISDFELFVMLSRGLTKESTHLLFGDLDLSTFEPCVNQVNGEMVLYHKETNTVIDKLIHMKIVEYIRKMHNIPKPKSRRHAANKTTKKILIEEDRKRLEKAQKEPYKSQLKELISGMMRYPGFKYKKSELKECGLYEFMDTVQGAQIYVSSTALLQGSYSGMIDTSKINKKEFNWMRSLDD